MSKQLKLSDIVADPRTQQRQSVPPGAVEDFRDKWLAGTKFPDVIVYHDGDKYWLADGHIRLSSAFLAKKETINAEVFKGGVEEAIKYSLSTNEEHGYRRTPSDRRKALLTALSMPDNKKISASALAKLCNVSTSLAAEVKNEYERQHAPAAESDGKAGKDGKAGGRTVKVNRRTKGGKRVQYEIHTSKIGRAPKKKKGTVPSANGQAKVGDAAGSIVAALVSATKMLNQCVVAARALKGAEVGQFKGGKALGFMGKARQLLGRALTALGEKQKV